MNSRTTLPFTLVFLFFALTLIGFDTSDKQTEEGQATNTIVLLKFKAQPEKSDYALSQFNELLNKVREEPNFVSIRLHVDPDDNTNIMLYEEWKDKNYYNNEHMNTTHLQQFMANSANFLTGPPEITFWEVEDVFEP